MLTFFVYFSLHRDKIFEMAAKRSLPKNFFLFVVLAFVLWMLAKFSKDYEATVLFDVSYEGLPKNKVLQNTPPNTIPIHIKGTGFKLISAKLFGGDIKLSAANLINLKENQYYILLNQQELSIEKQMTSGLSIDYFVKDSVFFDLGYLATKKVPVHIVADINFMPGYDFVDELSARPDSIEISGPDGMLDTITHIKTSRLTLGEVNNAIEENVSLEVPNAAIQFIQDIKEVQLNAAVDRFTEGVLEVPFEIDNLPENIKINAYPKTVKLSFKVGLSNFNKINENSFSVRCDYAFSEQNELTYLIPKLDIISDLVKDVKIVPNRIDFLIQK